MSEPRFPYLRRDVPPAEADGLGHRLMDLGATGIEVRDRTTMQKGPDDGRVRVVAWFASRADAERAREEVGGVVEELVGDGWRDAYKEHFKPFALTEELWVCPPWELVDGALVLDPGRAFGTGLHATTALVSAQLEKRRDVFRDATVLDVGTGSGILALAALRFGAARAVATDNDPEVLEVVAENAARNGLGDRLEVSTTDVREVKGSYPFVVANIRAPVLIAMADALRDRTSGWLVLSGVLASEEPEVREAFVATGLTHVETVRRDEPGPHEGKPDAWTAIVLQKP